MRWRKLGRVYAPEGDLWWAKSHAYLPTAEVISDKTIRVYFASLDENRFGRIGYVDLDATSPQRILYETKEPILDLGELGTFDDSGVSPSSVVNVKGKKYLYYIGWQRCERVPHMLFTGLAVSDSGPSFRRISRTPILDRTGEDPFLCSAPIVLYEQGLFKAWYVSALEWIRIDKDLYPAYVIKYAVADNGIRWKRHKHACIDFETEDEFGFGRPWVFKSGHTFRMWYSIRTKPSVVAHLPGYRIGYAESDNGVHWVRKDRDVGIWASKTGWDSEMICFSSVVDVHGEKLMFYNGNGHGSTGFGCAVLESW
jgi:hypothetical protein